MEVLGKKSSFTDVNRKTTTTCFLKAGKLSFISYSILFGYIVFNLVHVILKSFFFFNAAKNKMKENKLISTSVSCILFPICGTI